MVLADWVAAEGTTRKVYQASQPDDWTGIMWHGNSTSVPIDTPQCGWYGELCETESNGNRIMIALLSTMGACCTVALILALFMYIKKYKYDMILSEVRKIKVDWRDLEQCRVYRTNSRIDDLSGSSRMNVSQVSMSYLDGDINKVKEKRSRVDGYYGHGSNVECRMYKEQMVVIKTVGIHSIDLTDKAVLVHVKELVSMSHDNINSIVGLCTESPHACLLICHVPRGSIQDIIDNNDGSKLHFDFKISLLTDIASGMRYLQKGAIEVHGDLTSARCLVDSRWTCKVSAYGLWFLRKDQKKSGHKQLWTAPEMLRWDCNLPYLTTKKADVYSYGIMMQEILTQSPPFSANIDAVHAVDIIDKVKSQGMKPYRPAIPHLSVPEEWVKLMSECWAEDPSSRPTFSQILRTIFRLNHGKDINLIDRMIDRLDMHARKLEARVVERSIEIQQEKSKMEILLSELLPRSVAEQLMLGHQVQPESFECVTLFFSDIVGFTKISANATPMEIVALLNRMYTLFDQLTSKFDVYKIATIGDAYMVASGVPIRNGNRHAEEICHMAQALLNSIQDFLISSEKGNYLHMRTGIHTGPCVAGVAGNKTPRYLLFGDTVDTTAKMESSGTAMKIHASKVTKDLLENNRNFAWEKKGNINLKGNRSIETFWMLEMKDSLPIYNF